MGNKPKVVVVGAGFGGIAAVKKLAKQDIDIVIIERTNYHLFQPLLYQVSTSVLSTDDISYPVRAMFRDYDNV